MPMLFYLPLIIAGGLMQAMMEPALVPRKVARPSPDMQERPR